MQKINLVKAIIRYNPVNFTRNFVQGAPSKSQSARYLLLQKAEDKFFPENIGKWECSGGLVEKGETSKKAIERKVAEETGLKPNLEFRVIKQLPTITMKDENYDSHCDLYLIDASSMNLDLSIEHSDYQWFKAEDVKNQNLVLYANLLLEFFNNPEMYLN